MPNFATGRITDAHERFSGIRQVAPVCTPTWPTRILNPNSISIGLAIPQNVPILYNGPSLPPPQNCPFPWVIWTPSNTWFLGPNRVHNSNGISISWAVLQYLLLWQTDRQTDRPTNSPRYWVC